MARIILITGGCRSGKSNYARKLAESSPGSRLFVATCPVIDSELEQRIKHHQSERAQAGWQTVEETTDLANVLEQHRGIDTLLVDCLTLWINNLLYEDAARKWLEDDILSKCNELIAACSSHSGTIVFVTNEVGMGIVPENATTRLYRDLVGRCNQVMADAADEVIMMVSGMPLYLKK